MAFFFFLLLYLLMAVVILGIGYGAGRLLHWLWPALTLGDSIIIGLIVLSATSYLLARIMLLTPADIKRVEGSAATRMTATATTTATTATARARTLIPSRRRAFHAAGGGAINSRRRMN